jgi:hypothetical protein
VTNKSLGSGVHSNGTPASCGISQSPHVCIETHNLVDEQLSVDRQVFGCHRTTSYEHAVLIGRLAKRRQKTAALGVVFHVLSTAPPTRGPRRFRALTLRFNLLYARKPARGTTHIPF